MDPPWNERGGGKSKRGADKHYNTLKKHDIIKEIYQSGFWNPDDNCHMWMWVTDNYLKDGLFVMEALGFRYIRMAVWPKPSIRLGQYLRSQHEPCLFGVKGRLKSLTKSESSLFGDGKTLQTSSHSEKPLESYAKIERVSPGPKLEMFCRKRHHGWWGWGDELNCHSAIKRNYEVAPKRA